MAKVKAYNSKMQLVETDRTSCRKIQGEYFIVNEGCVLVDGTWHRINNGKVMFNVTQNKWVTDFSRNSFPVIYALNDGVFEVGIKEILPNDKRLDLLEIKVHNNLKTSTKYSRMHFRFEDYFSELSFTVLERYAREIRGNYQTSISMLSEVVDKAEKEKIIVYSMFFTRYVINIKDIHKYIFRKARENTKLIYSRDLQYSFGDDKKYAKAATVGFNNNKKLSDAYDDFFNEYFKGKSFGVEIETHSGQIPENMLADLGFVPLRDGSLNGGIEYTSIPFTNGKGLSATRGLYKLMQQICYTSQHCSMHLHIGGVKRDRLSLLTLYRLCYRLQEEMFDIVPIYKKSLSYWNSKRQPKDHCQSLKGLGLNLYNLNENSSKKDISLQFNKLFNFVAETKQGEDNDYNLENKNFPRRGNNKWNLPSRYYWVNFIPTMFTHGTVEFRIFDSPLDYNDFMNYFLISMAIILYAEKNGEIIRLNKQKISIEDLIVDTYDIELAESIIKFINHKRDLNYNDLLNKLEYAEIDRQNKKYDPQFEDSMSENNQNPPGWADLARANLNVNDRRRRGAGARIDIEQMRRQAGIDPVAPRFEINPGEMEVRQDR